MAVTDYKGYIAYEDLNIGTGTFERRTSTGEMVTLTQIPIGDTGTEAPTTGYYDAGSIRWNSAPEEGGNIGWVCTVAGSPGTWRTWGVINVE